MRKTFHYRIYPTAAQQTKLLRTLEECRWVYNQMLEQRQVMHDEFDVTVGYYDQKAWLPVLKEERPALRDVHSQVLQDIPMRLDLAFQAFFRRLKAGETPGYPRFRGSGRYNSLTYPQYGNGAKLDGTSLYLSKIGHVKVVLHRPIEGLPKTVTVIRSATGKWYVCIVCEWQPTRLPVSAEHVGIDVGLHTFATFSNAEQIANPRFFRQEERALAKVQRKHSTLEKDSPRRRKHRKAVARVHERTAWRRENHAHQHSRKVVNRFQVVAVEDLEVNRLVHNHCLAKSISDAAWTQFRKYIQYKAAWAGRVFVAVNPAYTSQTCSFCGHRQKMALDQRVYSCPCCTISLDRDHNAARNILALGLQRIGNQSIEAPPFTAGE